MSKKTFCSCQGTDLGNEIGVGSAEECLNFCFDTEGCSWVTYFQDDSFCVLLENCDGIEDCDDCIVASTNNEECDDDRPTGKVLLIMGGYNGTNMDNVEILDFEGGGCENIQLPPLPVATNWNLGMVQGDRELPMTCGGREYDNKVLTFLKKLFKLGQTQPQNFLHVKCALLTEEGDWVQGPDMLVARHQVDLP